jgi:hypothetical protein
MKKVFFDRGELNSPDHIAPHLTLDWRWRMGSAY